MNKASHERGQALVLIVFAIIGLVGITGLAVDGGLSYSERRNAQNAADNSALAAALSVFRNGDPTLVAKASALRGGYNNDGVANTVTVTIVDTPSGACPGAVPGKDITVQILSHIRPYFAPVVGIQQLSNTVLATARSCGVSVGPLFKGDAIVALAPSGIGFDAAGTPNWNVTGGGIFSNSSDSPSVRCKGAAGVTAPSVTAVGAIALQCSNNVPQKQSGASPYTYASYSSALPRVPACNGTAKNVGGWWTAAAGADGSKVAFNGDMQFAPGLYCVTNSPGPFHGQITGNWVTFYLMPSNFSMKLNGGGNLTAAAPITGEYTGVLMFSAAQLSGGTLQSNQSIDMRGNGSGNISGSIIVPSANVTLFGNSSGLAYDTQIIAYRVDSGGNANINLTYHASDGFQAHYPAWLTLLR